LTVRRIVPNLRAEEPVASRRFYEHVLGLELAMDMGWIATFVSPTNPTAQVNLSRTSTEGDSPDVTIEVDDVDATYARAVEAGFEIVRPLADEPWGVRRFFVRDPNGVVVNVMSHADSRRP
jgi:catechol 2,3-dioxygenase-like lactoylglutathione lyase family enzyme